MFKKNKYAVIKQAISKDLAAFIANYFSMKKQVYDSCRQARYISPYEFFLGEYEEADGQIPHTYSHYADIAMETLMLKCQPIMEKTTGLKLITILLLQLVELVPKCFTSESNKTILLLLLSTFLSPIIV